MPLSDTELMLKFKEEGDIDAFTELVVRHQRPLINFFYRLLWNKDLAEDYAQEVFIRLSKHALNYRAQAKFTTFLYAIAKNLWIDRVRQIKARPKVISLDTPIGQERDFSLGKTIPAKGTTPQEILSKKESIAGLKRAITSLPEEQRVVLILGAMQGWKYNEIAEVLNIPLGTVKSRMHTAIIRLKDLLATDFTD